METETSTPRAAGEAANPAAPAPSAPTSRIAVWWSLLKPALPFIGSFLLLDVMMNLRYPAPEPTLWFFVPSVDVVVLFFYFAVFGWNGWRVPVFARVIVVVLLFLVRLLRFGDGIQQRFFYQSFNAYTDLPVVPELIRFARVTVPAWKFWPGVLLVLGLLAFLVAVTYRALVVAERYLTDAGNMQRAGIATGIAFLVLSFVPREPGWEDLFFGGFGASVVPRIKHEAKFLANVYGYNEEKVRAIVDAQERLTKVPSNLAKLHHANVFLIFVESYGRTVFEKPAFIEQVRPLVESFETDLGARGLSIVSGVMDSPTYGGQSWLAHSTLATGVRTADQLQYELDAAKHPKTIAQFFHGAGYRTVFVMPGTTRDWPKGEFYGFDQKYYAWNFDYAGPRFSWSTMPDQYVMDFIRRTELANHPGPSFVEYVLVTSHAPWSHQPLMVDDWSKIQNGAIYRELEMVRYPIEWPNFANASDAYIRSIVYDLDVLKRYLATYLLDDTLVIMLGDHQPVREVTDDAESHGVPVHVVCREAALLEPFLARGFARGMTPPLDGTHDGLENFLIDFLQDYSTPAKGP